jgi:hypothetical protein
VGAALGVAVTGTIINAKHAGQGDFSRATHPVWWIMTGCGGIVLSLGWLSNTAWSRSSVKRVTSLLGEQAACIES